MKTPRCLLLTCAMLGFAPSVFAQDTAPTATRVFDALALDYRTPADRADDTLEYEVGRRSVAGNTVRFFFVFVKP